MMFVAADSDGSGLAGGAPRPAWQPRAEAVSELDADAAAEVSRGGGA